MEIDFPSRVPFEVYKGILQINKKQTSNIYFDKIVIDFEKGAQKEKNIYFIDTENRKMASSSVSNNEIQAFLNRTKQKQKSVYSPYEFVELGNNHYTFLPKSTTSISQYEYTIKDKDELESFKKILFNDPNSIQKSESKDKIEYFSSTSLMKIDLKNNMLSFVNPAENLSYKSDPRTLLNQSINFVNEHGGWTGEYRFFNLDNNSHQVIFRLFMDGYPVFNANDMAEIQQIWGENDEIYEYRRPYVALETQWNYSKKTLPSGKQVIKDLLANPHIQKNSIQDLEIGYTMQMDPDTSEAFSFEPKWYCLYEGTWSPALEIGRGQNGME